MNDAGDGNDRKRLLNEILPDPSQAETDLTAGGPRSRTIEHLKRILATAGAGLALQSPAVACAQDAGSPGDTTSKPADAGNATQDRPPAVVPPPPPPPIDPGYGVVDPLPYPPDELVKPGKLRLIAKPEAEIVVDGEATGKRTPHRLRLSVGMHTITLRAGAVEQTFTVEIESGKTITEKRDLRPAPAKKTGGDQKGK